MSGEVEALLDRFDGRRSRNRQDVPTTTAATAVRVAPTATPTTTLPRPKRPASWMLFAGGDVLMDRTGTRDPFSQLVPALAEADLALVNVETPVSDRGHAEKGKEFTFRSPPSAAGTMAAAGIDVANLGNNHSLDFGPKALLDTVRHLRQAGVAPVGAGRNRDEALAPAEFLVGGKRKAPVRVGVVGISDVLPAGWPAGPDTAGVASGRDGTALAAVEAAAAKYDVVVAMVHWGVELAKCPSEQQVALGDALVTAGASVVLGTHPHVLQPVVERGGGLIAYSLGNFAWHSRTGRTAETGVLEVRFAGPAVDGWTFHPHRLDVNGDPAPADAAANARIEKAVTRRCA
jgi:poly-gamma-glutamate synthesis protein (capsule biosynthesis protein)